MAHARPTYFTRLHGGVKVVPRQPDRSLKDILAELDGEMACVYCGARDDLTVDHVAPESRLAEFGVPPEAPNNKVLACGTCNWAKHDMTPAEAGYSFQPWVRRRTWLDQHYAGRPIPEQTPTGVPIDPERTARERKSRNGKRLGQGPSPGETPPERRENRQASSKARRHQRRLATIRDLVEHRASDGRARGGRTGG